MKTKTRMPNIIRRIERLHQTNKTAQLRRPQLKDEQRRAIYGSYLSGMLATPMPRISDTKKFSHMMRGVNGREYAVEFDRSEVRFIDVKAGCVLDSVKAPRHQRYDFLLNAWYSIN